MPRTLYLDTFATVKVASNPLLAMLAKNYIKAAGFELVFGVINMLEIFAWPKRWSEVLEFVSSVSFSIARSPEEIYVAEVSSYPSPVLELPVGFRSSDHLFSPAELRQALEIHLRGKIAFHSETWFKGSYGTILKSILDKRSSFPPEQGNKYSPFQLRLFLDFNVMQLLFPDHKDFLRSLLASGEEIKLERFKSAYIQVLAIFLEYYVQKKDGKASDIGDIHQLGMVPYIDLSVLDNERHDLVQRINRDKLFPVVLSTCNIADFITMVKDHERGSMAPNPVGRADV